MTIILHTIIMKKFLILSLGLFYSFVSFAQGTDAMLSGDVKSKETGEHLAYATIRVKGTNIMTVTDATGHYIIANLPEGINTVVASFVGYKEKEMKVEMKRGKSSNLFFVLDKDIMNMDQVVVTATRTEHFIKDVPIRTEVITSGALAGKNALNLYDALSGVPGIRVEQQCQFCNFSMVRMQGLGAEHTQVLIDGQPVYSGLAGVYGLQQLGTYNVDRIEVVKGSGSAFFGSSSVAGAINIISKEPSFVPHLKGDIQIGNFGHKAYNAFASMRSHKAGLNLYAQRLQGDAVDQTGDADNVRQPDGISDRVDTKLTSVGMDLFLFSPLNMNDKLILRIKGLIEDRFGGNMKNDTYLNPYTEGTENINTNRISADLAYKIPVGEKSFFDFTFAYVNHKRKATNDTFLGDYKSVNNDNDPPVSIMRPYIADEHTFIPTATFSSELPYNKILFGVQAYITRFRETGKYQNKDEKNPSNNVDYLSIGNKAANEYGLFLQDEINIGKFSAVPGIRLDYHASSEHYTTDNKDKFLNNFPEASFKNISVNPRIALKYEIMNNLILRANMGTGFRAPYGFSEDLHLCSGSPRVWKSSSLKGERSVSLNFSTDYFGKNYALNINLFGTKLFNKIEFEDASDEVKNIGYTYQWTNVDDAFVSGIEFGAKYSPFKNFNAMLNVTFNRGMYANERADWKDKLDKVKELSAEKNQDGTFKASAADVARFENYLKNSKFISRFPAYTGDLTLEYSPGTWEFAVTGQLQGKMYVDYNSEESVLNSKIKETPTFTIWNARISKTFSKTFKIYFGGKNIFNYLQDEKHLDDAAFMYAPVYGAFWYGGITVRL